MKCRNATRRFPVSTLALECHQEHGSVDWHCRPESGDRCSENITRAAVSSRLVTVLGGETFYLLVGTFPFKLRDLACLDLSHQTHHRWEAIINAMKA